MVGGKIEHPIGVGSRSIRSVFKSNCHLLGLALEEYSRIINSGSANAAVPYQPRPAA